MASGNGSRPLRLVFIYSDKLGREYVKRSLGDKGVRVVGEAEDIKAGHRLVRNVQPDVVLLELSADATDTVTFVQKVREEYPDTGVVIAAHDPSPQLILACMRAGAQEFVGKPIDAPQLEKALDHVRKLLERTVSASRKRGSVIAVASSKGGAGATSFTANLGVALAERANSRTVLVDLSFQMGDLGLMLDRPPRMSLLDALENGAVDEARLRSVLAQHDSGAFVLTVATSPEVAEEINRHHMVELFGALSTFFDYIVVDVGRNLDDRTVEVLELSDAILLLATLDLPTIRNAKTYIEILDRLEVSKERILPVVNRYQKKTRLGLKDLESTLGAPIFWTIPNDFQPVSLGIDAGNPAVLESPRSKVAQSFRDLAERLCGHFRKQSSSETVGANAS